MQVDSVTIPYTLNYPPGTILCLCISFIFFLFLPYISNPHACTLEHMNPSWLGSQMKVIQKVWFTIPTLPLLTFVHLDSLSENGQIIVQQRT